MQNVNIDIYLKSLPQGVSLERGKILQVRVVQTHKPPHPGQLKAPDPVMSTDCWLMQKSAEIQTNLYVSLDALNAEYNYSQLLSSKQAEELYFLT